MWASTRHCPHCGQAQGIAPIVGKHKALPLQNVNDFLIGINFNVGPRTGYAFTLGLGGMIHAT